MVIPTSDLTPVQLKTFRAIKRFMDEHGYPPTVGELSESLSRTKASIHANINNLIQKGFIRRTVGKARSLASALLGAALHVVVLRRSCLGQLIVLRRSTLSRPLAPRSALPAREPGQVPRGSASERRLSR